MVLSAPIAIGWALAGVLYIDFLDKAGRAVVVGRIKHHNRNLPAEDRAVLHVSMLCVVHHCSGM